MTIENKYEIGQKVYFLDKNKQAKCDVITSISAFNYGDHINILYSMKGVSESLPETECFPTKEALNTYTFKDLIEFV